MRGGKKKSKGCRCISTADKMLEDQNARVNWIHTLLNGVSRAAVSTVKINPRGKNPPLLAASFCPFCGAEYPENNAS